MGGVKLPLQSEVTRHSLNIEYYLIGVFVVLVLIKNWARQAINSWRRKCRTKDKNVVFCYDTYEKLPSPPMLPIIGALHHLTDIKDTIQMCRDFANVYGSATKLNLFNEEFIVINSAPMAHALLSSTEMGHLDKSPFFYDVALGQILGKGLITGGGHQWKLHRKLLSPCFSYKSFQNYCKIFVKGSKKLVIDLDHLFEDSLEGETKQISTAIHICNLQIITEAVMGLDLFNDKDGMTFYEKIKRAKDVFAIRLLKPILLLNFFWRLHPLSKEYDGVVETLNKITRRIIAKQKKIKEDLEAGSTKPEEKSATSEDEEFVTNGKTMIDEMLRGNMSDSEILDEVNTMIFAGFETTSSSVHFLMFLLALNPEHQKLCREEIDMILADPMKCPNGELTYEAINDLKYLERSLSEALRIFPPAFIFIRKLGSPVKLSDTLIVPKGVNAVVPTFTIHSNPDYFPEPGKFNPDRFLPENVRARHPGAYLPFSAGPRSCLGMKFATMVAKAMSAQIIRHFDVHTTDKINDVVLLPNVFLTAERDYNFILKRRKESVNVNILKS